MTLCIEASTDQAERIAVASLINKALMNDYMLGIIMQQVSLDLYDAASHGSGSPALDRIIARLQEASA